MGRKTFLLHVLGHADYGGTGSLLSRRILPDEHCPLIHTWVMITEMITSLSDLPVGVDWPTAVKSGTTVKVATDRMQSWASLLVKIRVKPRAHKMSCIQSNGPRSAVLG